MEWEAMASNSPLDVNLIRCIQGDEEDEDEVGIFD